MLDEPRFEPEVIEALPFVSVTDDGRPVSFWDCETFRGSTDVGTGEVFARLALDVARKCDLPLLVAMVMRDMVLAGRFGALEAGFLAAIATAAKAGSMN